MSADEAARWRMTLEHYYLRRLMPARHFLSFIDDVD